MALDPLVCGLEEVQKHLVTTLAEREAAGRVKSRLEESLRRVPHCCPASVHLGPPKSVYLGGSVAKGTCVRGSFDLDIVVELDDHDFANLASWQEQFKRKLHRLDRCIHTGLSMLKLECVNSLAGEGGGRTPIPVDLIFTSKSEGLKEHSKSLAFRAYHSQENDTKLVEQYDAHDKAGHHLRELIVLAKYWKKQMVAAMDADSKKDAFWMKSMHLELACLTAVQDVSEGQGFRMSFGRVLTLLRNGVDNEKLSQQLAAKGSYCGVGPETLQVYRKCARKSLHKMGLQVVAPQTCGSAGGSNLETFYVFMKPCEIRFTQDNCSPKFRDGKSIGETARELRQGEIQKRDIEMIRLVENDGDACMYSVDNRRLAVFRLLAMNGHAKIVKARVLAKSDLHDGEWKKKHSTTTEGSIIKVSKTEWKIGRTKDETDYPWDKQTSVARDNLDGLDSDDEGARPLKVQRVGK